MRQIIATALLVFCTLACCSPPSAAEPCGGFTDMRLYVSCLQNQVSSGCGHACETNKIQCPKETYSVGEYCMPKSSHICPNRAVYTNGSCQVYTRPTCPPKFTYNNGVCVGESACKQNPIDCTIAPNHCQGFFGSCDHPTVCSNGLILFNGSCVLPDIAKCPKLMTLVDGICVRQKLPCEMTGNCPRSCPTESKMVNGTCVRISPCPGGSFQIGGVCARCPLGSFYAVGECLSCPSNMLFEDNLCVCPGDMILFNNTCMENPFTIQPDTDGSGDGGGDDDEKVTPIEPETDENDWLEATTETQYSPTTEKVRGDQPPGPHKYTHIFNVTENTYIEDTSEKTDKIEECCLITEPIQCAKSGLQYRCIKRRHHACGDKCNDGESKKKINPYNLIEPRFISEDSPQAIDSLLFKIPSEQTTGVVNQHQHLLQNIPITHSINLISNQYPNQQNKIINSPEVATSTTKPAISQQDQNFIPLNGFIYDNPNLPITEPKVMNIDNPLISNEHFKILLNYDQTQTYNKPQLMEFRQLMQDHRQIIDHQPIQQHQIIYQHPLHNKPQLMEFRQLMQDHQQIIDHQPIQQHQLIYQHHLQEQQNYHQPIQQHQVIYQHHLQEQQNNHQPIQQQQMFYQQPLHYQQINHNQHMQGQKMFHQQPLLDQNLFYQQPSQQSVYQQPILTEQKNINHQQLMQEPQLPSQQPLQEHSITFQQFVQAEQQPLLAHQVMHGQQWQEPRMIYQQSMKGQQITYQPQQFIGPVNCNSCP